MCAREEVGKTFLISLAVSVTALVAIYFTCYFFFVPATVQEGIKISLALTPAEAEKEFCKNGQELLVIVAENRLGKAVCVTVALKLEEKKEK